MMQPAAIMCLMIISRNLFLAGDCYWALQKHKEELKKKE
jgi:hypothetical protein